MYCFCGRSKKPISGLAPEHDPQMLSRRDSVDPGKGLSKISMVLASVAATTNPLDPTCHLMFQFSKTKSKAFKLTCIFFLQSERLSQLRHGRTTGIPPLLQLRMNHREMQILPTQSIVTSGQASHARAHQSVHIKARPCECPTSLNSFHFQGIPAQEEVQFHSEQS